MEKWEKKQKHENEVREVLKDQKCIDSQGRIRKWTKEVVNALKESGHTSLDYKKCKCHSPALKF